MLSFHSMIAIGNGELPRSEWCSSASGLPRRQIAITRACCAVIGALIDQPTTRREKRSMTAARSAIPFAVGSRRFEVQLSTSRTCFESLELHHLFTRCAVLISELSRQQSHECLPKFAEGRSVSVSRLGHIPSISWQRSISLACGH